MFKIGCHLSISKGYLHMAKTAVDIGANTFQYFSRNPRSRSIKLPGQKDLDEFIEYCKDNSIYTPLTHCPYTLNFAAYNPTTRSYGKQLMKDDLSIIDNFSSSMYVIHPGSHTELPREEGMSHIVNNINSRIELFPKAMILLETMSGKGTEIGVYFEELAAMIAGINHKENIGVCFDTCHLFAAGYDIVNDLNGVIEEFDSVVGLKYLKAIHLNDSLEDLNSHKDRHALIGRGKIGKDAIINIVNNEKLKELPFYLETPNDLEGYQQEISFLKTNYSD